LPRTCFRSLLRRLKRSLAFDLTRRVPATADAIVQADLDRLLALTEGVWEDLRSARLFITGATGFGGKWLLESFAHANDRLALGAEAVVLSRDPGRFAGERSRLATHPAIKFLRGDISTFDAPRGAFTHAIHGATDVARSTPPLETFDVIVEGTRHVIDFCRDRGVRDLLL